MIDGYYNRYDRSKNYEQHLFRAGYVLQSAELNELQSAAKDRLRRVANAIFKDGDVLRDAQIIVDESTGECTCGEGDVYIDGAVRTVEAKTFFVPTEGIVAVGVRLVRSIITENEDPDLRDPATITRNYMEPGAARERVVAVWGFAGDGDDDQGEFYPVYTVEDGVVHAKEPPPNLDAITQAIARYDIDSAGSNYIVSGMQVQRLEDDETGRQVYSIKEGRARINGFGVTLPASRRVVYDAQPVLRLVDSEPHIADSDPQEIFTDRWPIANVQQVRITKNKTVTVTHGNFSGAIDPLPDTAIVEIIEVKQGETVYEQGTDYKLTAGQVDWSLAGAEPSPGSTYTVEYNYITTATPTDITDRSLKVADAVAGTTIFVTYNVALPRIDRMVMNQNGEIGWVQGVSTDFNPVPPQVPSNVIPIARVYQYWDDRTRVVTDGVRMVSMSDLEAINNRIDDIYQLLAQSILIADVNTREAVAKKGLFVDPFMNDSMRDQGLEQTAAIVDGALMLPMEATAFALPDDVEDVETCDFTLETVLEQPLRTGGMKVNPYMAFSVIPARVTLTPAVDQWTETQTNWASDVTMRFARVIWEGVLRLFNRVRSSVTTETNTTVRTIGETASKIEHLRQIDVTFRIEGFGPGEELQSVVFDGIEVEPNNV